MNAYGMDKQALNTSNVYRFDNIFVYKAPGQAPRRIRKDTNGDFYLSTLRELVIDMRTGKVGVARTHPDGRPKTHGTPYTDLTEAKFCERMTCGGEKPFSNEKAIVLDWPGLIAKLEVRETRFQQSMQRVWENS